MTTHTLITGASSGIGRATALRLAKEHWPVILVARREDRLREVQKEIEAIGGTAMIRTIDLTNTAARESLFNELRTIEIGAVVNNAGMALGREYLEAAQPEDIDNMITLNISTFLHVLRLSIPLVKKTQGHLVNLGSIAGHEVYEGGATYCGSKHFVHAVSKAVRLELAGSGVRVTVIAPGAVETEFSVVRYKGDIEKASQVYDGYQPLTPEDVAEGIWYALNQPKHVNVDHLLIMPTAQSGITKITKS